MACFKNNKQTFVWKQKKKTNQLIYRKTGGKQRKKYKALSWLSPD